MVPVEKGIATIATCSRKDLHRHHAKPSSRSLGKHVHIRIAAQRLRRLYEVDIELKTPKVPYRETIGREFSSSSAFLLNFMILPVSYSSVTSA